MKLVLYKLHLVKDNLKDEVLAYSLADATLKLWERLPSEIRGKWEPEDLISHINKVEK